MYPRFVYRCPGPLHRPGGTFDHVLVRGDEEAAQKFAEGWFSSLPEAIEGKGAEKPIDDSAPPTRAELEEKATELGLKFDGRTTDKKLFSMINEAIWQ